jgi:hypothetical protein
MPVVINGDTGISPVTASGTSASVDGMTVGRGGGESVTNTATGYVALASNSSGTQNSAFGNGALNTNSSGANNTAIGYYAQVFNTTGGNNTSLGVQALYSNTTASNNTAVGYISLYSNTTGASNTAFGHQSLYSNTTGTLNVALGPTASYFNTTGSQNVSIGYEALKTNTTAANSTAIGFQALFSNTGTQNTAIGAQALYSNTSSVNNTAVGYQAGQYNTASGNIFIGQGAGTTRATTGEFNILIGATAQNSATGGAYEIVIGTNNPTGKGGSTGFINANGGGVYQGNNSASWSTTSDRRLKKNIVDNTEGLDKITAIRVRNFEYKLPEEVTELEPESAVPNTGVQLGVIAQELQAVLPDCVKEETTGVLSVDPDNLTWYMINAIKELKAEFDAYKATHP